MTATKSTRAAKTRKSSLSGVKAAEAAIREEAPRTAAHLKKQISTVCNYEYGPYAVPKGREREAVPGTLGSLHAQIDAAAARVKCLYSGPQSVQLCSYFEQVKHQAEEKDFLDKVRTLRAAARETDTKDGEEARLQLAEIHKVSTVNWMQATSNWAGLMETRTLAHDEEPWLESSVPMEVGMQSIGEDGTPTELQPLKRQGQERVRLGILSTAEYVYPTMDLYKGFNVKQDALSQVDLSRDMTYQVDAVIQQLLLVGAPNSRLKASFTTSGPERLRDYYAHSRIDTDNFPDGNLIVPDSNSPTSNIRKEILDIIINYCQSWGNNVWGDGTPLRPVNLILPSAHAAGWLESVEISNTQSGIGHTNPVVEQIFQNGHVISYGGYTWNVLGDNTLSPSSPYVYVQFNKPVGYLFFKPALDKVFIDNSKAMQKQNMESIFMTRVWGAGFLSNLTPNFMAIRYRD